MRLRGPAELADRLKQATRAVLERAAPPTTLAPHQIARAEPLMPFELLDKEGLQSLRTLHPAACADMVQRADAIRSGRFSLLGYRDLNIGWPVDWQRDAISGRRADVVHWSQVPFLDFDKVGDHKVTWELNRHQWMVTLGQAWRLTGDRAYADFAVASMLDWIDANPVGQGMNWASSLEVALRAIAWIWTLHFLRDAMRPDAAERARIGGVLRAHGRHVERNLSTYFSPNTHLTGEALGLLYLGATLPSLPEASRWSHRGFDILAREADRQLRGDGTYFEQAMWYQGYTVDFLLHGLRLATQARLRVPDGFRARTEAGAIVLLNELRPAGDVARIGDDDGGRLCGIDMADPADHRGTVGLAAIDFAWLQLPREASPVPASLAWIAGMPGLKLRERATAPQLPSRAFTDGGIYRLAGAEGSWMLVDAGPHGALTGAHAHADPLSFELALGGRMVIVDSGTGRYVGPEREAMRSSLAHNMLVVDGKSCGMTAGPFRWTTTPTTRVLQWRSDSGGDFLDAEHDGYEHGMAPLRHRRRFLRLENTWIIIDRWIAAMPVQVEARLHLASDLRAAALGEQGFLLFDSAAAGEPVFAIASDCKVTVVPTTISPAYGRLDDSSVICVRPPSGATGYLVTVLGLAAGQARVARADNGTSVGWALEFGTLRGQLTILSDVDASVAWQPDTDTTAGDA